MCHVTWSWWPNAAEIQEVKCCNTFFNALSFFFLTWLVNLFTFLVHTPWYTKLIGNGFTPFFIFLLYLFWHKLEKKNIISYKFDPCRQYLSLYFAIHAANRLDIMQKNVKSIFGTKDVRQSLWNQNTKKHCSPQSPSPCTSGPAAHLISGQVSIYCDLCSLNFGGVVF